MWAPRLAGADIMGAGIIHQVPKLVAGFGEPLPGFPALRAQGRGLGLQVVADEVQDPQLELDPFHREIMCRYL